jgi:hypothetical protein
MAMLVIATLIATGTKKSMGRSAANAGSEPPIGFLVPGMT